MTTVRTMEEAVALIRPVDRIGFGLGPGIPDGRLAQAAAAGRFGISHSISGRLRDLGGSATVSSVLGEGTVVELRLPCAAGVAVATSPGTA